MGVTMSSEGSVRYRDVVEAGLGPAESPEVFWPEWCLARALVGRVLVLKRFRTRRIRLLRRRDAASPGRSR